MRAAATRQGIATESTAALTRVGFVEEAPPRRPLPSGEGKPLRDVTIFTLLCKDFNPELAAGIRAFDASGEQVL